jgi:uncharacterized membrane protein
MTALGLLRSARFGFLVLASLTACGSGEVKDEHAAPNNEHTTEAVCAPTAPTECPEPAPHFADVAPIFEQRCASCHTGIKDAPWPLDNYEHVVDWASVIRDELLQCLMPPAGSGVEMTPEERQAVLVWVRCGSRE